jgi:hypothetical protein
MAPTAFARLSEERGIPPEAFAAGYMTFFIYTGIIGVLALFFAIAVVRQQRPPSDAKAEPAPA